MPKISVIVPVYNVEPYLRRCVDSILGQTFEDFELILVDDGSTDGSPSICDEYKAKDSRVVVIHKSNAGVSSARNTALDIVRGEYTTFVDSDDYIESTWLSKLYSNIQLRNADMLSTGFIELDNNGHAVYEMIPKEMFVEIKNYDDVKDYFIQYIFDSKLGINVWTRIFRTSIISENHIRFCETCENYAEDLCFVIEYSIFCRAIASIGCTGYWYCERNGSLSQKARNMLKLNAHNEVSKHFYNFICENNCTELISVFPIFHFLIMNSLYKRYKSIKAYRLLKNEVKKISDYKYFFEHTSRLLDYKKQCTDLCGKERASLMLIRTRYLLDGNIIRMIMSECLSSKERCRYWIAYIIKCVIGGKKNESISSKIKMH